MQVCQESGGRSVAAAATSSVLAPSQYSLNSPPHSPKATWRLKSRKQALFERLHRDRGTQTVVEVGTTGEPVPACLLPLSYPLATLAAMTNS